MILPYFDYINFCLCSCTNKILTKLERLQNRALRICFRATHFDGVVDLHRHTKISTIDKRCDVDILKVMHRNVYNVISFSQSPVGYSFTIIDNSNQEMSSTRARRAPIISSELPRSEKSRRSLLYYGISLWNNLSTDIRNIDDSSVFKSAVKRLYYSAPD